MQLTEAIIKHTDPYLRAVASDFASTPEAANDLVQDAWLSIFASLDSYRSDSQFTTWASAVARRAIMNRVRQDDPHIWESLEDAPEVGLDDCDPYTMYSLNQIVDNISAWIDEQDEDKQEILKYRFVEGYEYNVIGALVGKTADTVRKMCNRAEKHMRKIKEA